MVGILDIWGLQTALDAKADKYHDHRIRNITGLEEALSNQSGTGFNPSSSIDEITGLQDALDSKAPWSQVNALADSLDGKAAAAHGHGITDITDLESILDGKAAAAHGHAIADITGLQDALDSLENSPNGIIEIADINGLTEALAQTGTENLNPTLLTYTISQSSIYSGTTAGTYANLTDGSFTTGAGTQAITGTNWIKATFSQPTRFNRLSFAAGIIPNFGSTQVYINGCSIEISMDNTIWMRLFEGTLSEFLDASGSVWYAFSPVTALHVRVRRTSNSVAMTEFKIYG